MATTTTKKYRWVCPVCKKGVLASKGIRKDNAKRICLPCTGKTGKLTYRTIPSIEKAKAAKKAKAKAAAQAKRERKAKAEAAKLTDKYTHCGIDLRTEFLWVGRCGFVEKSQRQWDLLVKKLDCRKTVRYGTGNANVHVEGKEKGRIFISTSGYDSFHVLYNMFWCMSHYVIKTARTRDRYRSVKSQRRELMIEAMWRSGYLTEDQKDRILSLDFSKSIGSAPAYGLNFRKTVKASMDHPTRLQPLYEAWCKANPTLVP